MRPRAVCAFLRKVAETIPGEFPVGNRAAKGYLAVGDGDDLPIALAGAHLRGIFFVQPGKDRIGK